MAKIDRYNGNLLAPASAALGTERTIFGEVTQSDDLTDQFTADLLRGWGIVGPSDEPTLQDFNAMGFTLGQLHAYIHQVGVPEYNALQEYHIGSIANLSGVLYKSLVNDNVGNNPASSPAEWEEVSPPVTEPDGIPGLFSNLKLSATGLSAIVSVTASSLTVLNSLGKQEVLKAVSVSPSLATSGANGLDAGTSAINTWYSVWVIWNGTTVAGLLSLADGISTQPTLPSGYTHKARVGWVRSDSNASNKFPLAFIQLGRNAEYKIAAGTNLTLLPVIASGVLGSIGVTLVSAAVGAFVPPTASRIRGRLFNGGGITSAHISPSSIATVPGNSGINASVGSAGSASIVIGFDFALETTNLWYSGTAAACEARASGWEDNL